VWCDKPIITLPGTLMCCCPQTFGLLKLLGLVDLVAVDGDAHVAWQCALRREAGAFTAPANLLACPRRSNASTLSRTCSPMCNRPLPMTADDLRRSRGPIPASNFSLWLRPKPNTNQKQITLPKKLSRGEQI